MRFQGVFVDAIKWVIFTTCLLLNLTDSVVAAASLNPGVVESSQTICSGSTPNPFTSISSASGGIGPYNYKWQQSTTGLFTGYTDIPGAISLTYSPGPLTQTTYFRRAVSTLDDPIAFSDPITITVNAPSVGGTVSGGGHYCPVIALPSLSLTGNIGNIIRWERCAVSNFSTNVVSINVITSNYLTTISTPSTFYYRAVVKNGACPEVFSSIDSITIDSASVGGTIIGGTSVCAGTNSTTLTLSGHKGSVLKWQSSTSPTFSNSITDIVNTSNTYVANNISVPTYFRAVVMNGTCVSTNSTIASILILPSSVGGTISGPLGFCNINNSSTLTLSSNVGTIIEWQSSASSNFTGVVNSIPNTANLSSYTVVNLSSTMYYRVLVRNNICDSAYSSIKVLSALTPFPVAGSISGPSSLCTGANNGTFTLTGYSGSVLKWQSCLLANFSSGVVDIANTTNTLNVLNVNSPTYYRAIVFNGPIACEDTTTPKLVTIDTEPIAGVLSGNDSICSTTSINSTLFTLTGYFGTIVKWQSSTSSDFSSNITDIINLSNSYTATNITATTYFRVIVTNGACNPDTSNIGFVFVYPTSVGGAVFGNNPFNPNVIVCTGINSSMLVLTGYTGNILKWQSSTDPTFSSLVIDIPNTSSTYIATNLTSTTYYRVLVQSGDCDTAISAIRVITVNPKSDGGIIANDTVCRGSNNSTLRLKNYVGNVVKWESSSISDFSIGVISIPNTADSLLVLNLNTTTYYRVIVKSGVCSADTSLVAEIVVDSLGIGGTITGGGKFCTSNTLPVLTLTGNIGNVVRWERSSFADFSSNITIINFTGTVYSTTINTPSKFYYRAVVKNGVCPEVYSAIDSVIIYPNSIGGNIIGNNAVCSGINSTVLTLAGYVGTIIKWQSSTSPLFTSNVIDIVNTSSVNVANNLTTSTYYRAVVKNEMCSEVFSNIAVITVDSPSSAGLLMQSDTVCAGSNSTTLHLYNYLGTIIKWQSTTSVDFNNNVVDIISTADSLIVNNLSTTNYYRVIVQNGVCSADTSLIISIYAIGTTYVNVIYSPQPDSFLNAGNPNVIVGTTGNSDSTYIQYQWQYSTTSDTSGFINIVGATTRNYDPSLLTQTTWYRRILYNTFCSISDTSNVVKIKIYTETIRGTAILGVSKSVAKPKAISFGVYQINYTITLKNYGTIDLNQVSVIENLSSVFPSPAEFTVSSVTVGSGLTANPNFDGVTNLDLLDASQSILNIGTSSTIIIRIVLKPNLPNITYNNLVIAYGTATNASITVVDTSVNGDNPDPNFDTIPNEVSPTPLTISVFVPTGYSPNGDGKNDEFIIIGLENYPNNKLEIYNRWGNKVFEQAPYDNTWKGTVKNSVGYVIGEGLLPSGTYFYLLDFGVPGVEQLSGYIVIRK